MTTTTSYIGRLEEVSVTSRGSATTTTTAYYGGVALSVNGALSYLLSDGLGSVTAAVSTSSGAVTATQLYSPYGSVRYSSGTLPTSYGFTGQRADAATGLDYYNARYYDPIAGQFTSADTTLAGGLNRYAYVGGNPTTRTDPSGHLYRNPRDYSQSLAMQQSMNAPHVYFGSLSAFISDSIQYFTGINTLRQSFHTIFQDPHASMGDKVKAAVTAGATLVGDAVTIGSFFVGDPEAGEAVQAGDEAMLAADGAEEAATAATSDVMAEASADCGLSFAAATRVETPHGEQPIASLKVGQQVEAYDPTTGKTAPQIIVRVFLNHDSDRLDVTLATQTQTQSPAAAQSEHGRRAAHVATRTVDEVIHTTANHPWLTADQGWLVAGKLRVGESVRLLDGGTATVVALHVVPGVGAMWDLSLSAVHTFAVGDAQAVVHNCPSGGDPVQTQEAVESAPDAASAFQQMNNRLGPLGDDPHTTPARFGEAKDLPNGMQSADRQRGWRVEWDESKGAHFNWYDWTEGNRGTGGRWGAVTFPASESEVTDMILRFSEDGVDGMLP